jgi:hypothetical protein
MKILINLIGIVAVLFVSCSRKSFTTQRYTHFSHSASKSAVKPLVKEKQHALAVRETIPAKAIAEQVAPVTQTPVIEKQDDPLLLASAAVSHHSAKPNAIQKSVPEMLHKHFKSIPDQAKTLVKSVKKADKQSNQARGVVKLLLKIIILILLLAILIAAIILAGLIAI